MQLFPEILLILFLAAQAVLALYLLIPFLLLLGYSLVRLLHIKSPFHRRAIRYDCSFEFALIITAHQETEFIDPLVDSILKQTYPNFTIYIVADDCDISNINYTDSRVVLLKPEPALHAKIKSIQYALDRFRSKPDAVIILDSDNLIHPEFLATMNAYFQKGYKVVQCDFKAKNTDSHFARMDAIGDMFNFFLEREARMRLGLSSAIWGSGVAVDYDLYREVEYSSTLGGFDKKLQSHLVKRVDRIAFAPEAILYDEKIDSGKSLETQRTRWINAYFKYFRESGHIFREGMRRKDLNLLFFGFNILRPPLFIVLGGAFFFLIADFFLAPAAFYTWLAILGSFLLSFALIVLIRGKDARFLGTLFLLPAFAARQVLALAKIKKAKKAFLKTKHTKVMYIDELIGPGKEK